MTTDAYGNHLCDDCLRRQAQEDLVIDNYLYSLCQSCYKDRIDQKEEVKA
jgi:ribosomal protein L34E